MEFQSSRAAFFDFKVRCYIFYRSTQARIGDSQETCMKVKLCQGFACPHKC
jgi:hypothetical protein